MPEKPGSDHRSSGLESRQRSCYSPKIHRTLTPDKPRFTRLQKQSYHNKTQVNKSACLNQTFVTGKKKAATSTALPFTPLPGAAPCPAASRALPEQRALNRGQVRTLLLFPSWLSVYVSNSTCCAKNKRLWHDFCFFCPWFINSREPQARKQKSGCWARPRLPGTDSTPFSSSTRPRKAQNFPPVVLTQINRT